MTMSEPILIEEALQPGENAAAMNESRREAIETPSEEASIPASEVRDDEPKALEEAAVTDDSTQSQDDDTEIRSKVVPKPVTVEDVSEPETEPAAELVQATQVTETTLSGDTHLTPKVSVLTTTASPAISEANEPLPPLSGGSPDGALLRLQLPPGVENANGPPPTDAQDVRDQPERISSDVSLPTPTALSYLDADSPPVTKEAIRQSTLNAARRGRPGVYNDSPSSYSHSSLGSAAYSSDVFSRADHGVESIATWSPSDRYSLKTEGHPPREHHPPEFHRSWTSPDARMPQPPMSHIGGSPTQPRFPPPSPFPFNEHVPSSGYQMLATKLSGDIGGIQVKPIYRRFEALNHRLLLSLQDEIQNLEEQLSGVDSADTQNRTYPGGIYPASLRQEAASGGELYWRKTEILTQIGYRLHQYNKLLMSFRDTTDLPAPTINDVQDYRGFLSHGNYITPDETRFLAATNDLITLDEAMLRGADEYSEDLLTPMPRSATEPEFPILVKSGAADGEKVKAPVKPNAPVEPPKPALPPSAITHLALAIFVAVLVPIFTFAVIPDFAGRITVVVLVASSVLSTLLQSGLVGLLIEDRGVLALMLCVIVYGGVMATTAATFA